jgi:hypothetical protein
MALNPIAFTEKVVTSFLRYQLTTYPLADENLLGQMRRLLSLDQTRRSPLMKGFYISLSRPFSQGAGVEVFVQEGLLHPHMSRRIPSDIHHVYGHQEKAIRPIHKGKNTLISTGTGSGKPECFMYPIVSRCLKLRGQGAPAGISAVIVYPMNALAELCMTARSLPRSMIFLIAHAYVSNSGLFFWKSTVLNALYPLSVNVYSGTEKNSVSVAYSVAGTSNSTLKSCIMYQLMNSFRAWISSWVRRKSRLFVRITLSAALVGNSSSAIQLSTSALTT